MKKIEINCIFFRNTVIVWKLYLGSSVLRGHMYLKECQWALAQVGWVSDCCSHCYLIEYFTMGVTLFLVE